MGYAVGEITRRYFLGISYYIFVTENYKSLFQKQRNSMKVV
jgi:hypothetical protein